MTFLYDDKKISTFYAESLSYTIANDYLKRDEVIDLIDQLSSILGQSDWIQQYILLTVKYKIEDYIFSRDQFVASVENALSGPVYQPAIELFAGAIGRVLDKGMFINTVPFFDSDLYGFNRRYLEPKSRDSRILVTIRDGLNENFSNDLWPFGGSANLLDHAVFMEIGKPLSLEEAKRRGLGYFSTRIGLLKNHESRELFNSVDFGRFNLERRFFQKIVAVLIYSVFYWKRLYRLFDIRLTIEGEERQFLPFFKKLAAYSYDGVGRIIGIQRSESYFPIKTLGPEIARDMYFSWSKTFEFLHCNETLPNEIVLATAAHRKRDVGGYRNIAVGDKNDRRLVVGFDNIYGNLGNPLTSRSYERFIQLFIELLVRHEDINVLIKLKSPRNSLHPIFSSCGAIKQFIDDDRLTLWREPRTDVLSFKDVGSLFIGMGVSSAISELGLRGYNAVNFDVMGVRSFHPLYQEPYREVIFDSDSELLARCGELFEGKIGRLGYWPEFSDSLAGQPSSFESVIENLLTDGRGND